jgi:hypothetical protein
MSKIGGSIGLVMMERGRTELGRKEPDFPHNNPLFSAQSGFSAFYCLSH